MLLKHTPNTKPDRAAEGVERITMQRGETNWGEGKGFNSLWKNARFNLGQESQVA